jgi:HSP20 family protein
MLMRFDPFRELDRLTGTGFGRQWPGLLAMDAWRHGDEFLVAFDLPGARADSIELSVEKNVLTVNAERSWQRSEGDEVVVSERPQGQFSRQLFLGEGLDPDKISASYQDGVLRLTIPVAEKAKPRQIQVQVEHSQPQSVEAASTDRSEVGSTV